MDIKEVKEVWIVQTTKDMTEGRTPSTNWKVCETESTARRIGKGRFVMGSDCPIEKSFAVKIGHSWFYPGEIVHANDDDLRLEERKAAKMSLIERLESKGFTKEEIDLLGNH